MIKKLDLYIIRKFLGTFFFTLLLFVLVAVVIDLSENVDDFLEHNVPIKAVLTGYYMNFIPYIVLMLSPLFIFIAVIFFTSQLASRSEIVAILSSGVSFYRILFVPYLISAILLIALQYYANHYLVPTANRQRFEFNVEYMDKREKRRENNISMQITPDTYIFMKTYNIKDQTGTRFSMETVKDSELIYKLKSDKIKWIEDKKEWQLSNFVERSIEGLKENLETGKKLDKKMAFDPSYFGQRVSAKEEMTTPELDKFIEREKIKGGNNLTFFLIEKYRRSAVPFATLILTIIGFSIASRKTRGGMGVHILIGITISSAFVVMMQFSTTFATNANLPPLLAVWLPNIVFGVLSVILLRVAPK